MDDKTPTPDQTPDHASDQPTVPVTPASDAAPQAPATAEPSVAQPQASAPAAAKPGRKRALLIGGGIAAAIVLAGGGVAVGAAIGDDLGDDDDRPSMSDGPRHDAEDRGDDRGGDQAGPRDDDGGPANGQGPATGIGSDSADELIDIAEAARGAAEGDVTSIDAKRDGAWEVQLTTASGDETEVRVDEKLAATVISSEKADGDDTGPALTLDDETIRSLVAAALAEAEGLITDLDVDSDDVSPYDASVLTQDNRSIDIDFTADFAVVGTDTDD
ncbi:hypothetical protein [Microbacterium sp. EST19A]|uniref:hypothetical protein n=1 Tax=Microbacterium sp. EST19A TaxID=2862681 RepID=UPI001CC1513C|nr:hypothetical protein [Microbacterium sp. EST19A]